MAYNEKYIWDYLKSQGMNDYATAGIMGNLYAESGLNPKNLQNRFEESLGFTDESYTAAVTQTMISSMIRLGMALRNGPIGAVRNSF